MSGAYIANWNFRQQVTYQQMSSCTTDLYQRLAQRDTDRPVPYIFSGLSATVDASGLVTITAGDAIGPNYNQSDNPDLPANGLEGAADFAGGTSQITAVGNELGIVVLRLTLTPVTAGSPTVTVGFTITGALLYIAGTSTTYPAIGAHDIPLIGTIAIAGSPIKYQLDLTKRACDSDAYAATMAKIPYFQNPNFDYWNYGISTFTIVPNTRTFVGDGWQILSDSTTSGLSVTQYTLADNEQIAIPNSPTYGTSIVRAVASATGTDVLLQDIQGFTTVCGKYLIISFWLKLTCSTNINGFLNVNYYPDGVTLTPIANLTTGFTAVNGGVFTLYSIAVAIPGLIGTVDGVDGKITFNINLNANHTYTAIYTAVNNLSGKYYLTPYNGVPDIIDIFGLSAPVRIEADGWITQFGSISVATGGHQTITLPVPFKVAYSVATTLGAPAPDGVEATPLNYGVDLTAGLASFIIRNRSTIALDVVWIAVGY